MEFVALNIPVWKTKAYILAIEHLHGTYRIYLKRLGIFYMRNEHGLVVKFRARDAKEEEFYTKVYKEKRKICTGIISVVSQ